MLTEQVYNFAPGPATLPPNVVEQTRLLLAERQPVSILEMGHHSTYFEEVVASMEQSLRRLLNISDDYAVLFIPGGSRGQYAAVPLNFAYQNSHTDYFNTGHWSQHAINEGQRYSRVKVVSSLLEEPLLSMPPRSTWQLSDNVAYRHYVANETLTGFEFFAEQAIDDGSLVADMTSNFLTCPINIRAHKMIYAGAQKNAGVSGLVYAIIARDALLQPCHPMTPMLYDYNQQIQRKSRATTPPVITWVVAQLMLEWIELQGGVAAMRQLCEQRASLLYDCIDQSDFYNNPVSPHYRSRVNVFFRLPSVELEQQFIDKAAAEGLLGLKGHNATGGVRASLYNGMPLAGAETLVQFMKDFEQRYNDGR